MKIYIKFGYNMFQILDSKSYHEKIYNGENQTTISIRGNKKLYSVYLFFSNIISNKKAYFIIVS